MVVDFLHNQIIRDTVSAKFIESFNENLLPRLLEEYGDRLSAIQFYEDHIASHFRVGGEFHYPLTLVVDGAAITRWIKWPVANYRHYINFNPFTYKGQDLLTFTLPESVPAEMRAAIKGKPIYHGKSALPVILSIDTDDKTFLSGKYSQAFVDLLSVEITELIEREMSVSGLAGSGVVLDIAFKPGTFMEHIVENTTYRRILIKARACAPRDLWIKWTRLDGNGTYGFADNVLSDDIAFALAEDVPGKIKEREYRYLTAESLEKYQNAMGRKNITAWREVMRRVIKRGEVEPIEREELEEQITPPTAEDDSITDELLEQTAEAAPVFTEEPIKATVPDTGEAVPARDPLAALFADDDEDEDDGEQINDDLAALLRGVMGIDEPAPTLDEEPCEPTAYEEDAASVIEEATAPAPITHTEKCGEELEEKLRREIEAKLRAEYEAEMQKKHDEAEELRAKLEARERAEQRERELLAEAAREAIQNKENLERELRAQAELEERERARREAEAEKARLEKEREERERAVEEERRAEEERALIEAEAAAKAAEEERKQTKYVSKHVKLIFRRAADVDITAKIQDIIVATIKYLHKENVYMRIKATVPDSYTVNLDFTKFPENEMKLLEDIIQVLGKSNLGIVKAILE